MTPRPALANASPPHRLTHAISSRLSGHSLAISVLSALMPRGIASRQRASVKGFARAHSQGSITWVRASRPEARVTARGVLSVSDGSTIARSGSMRSSRRLTLRCCSGTLITAFFVTSAPVPAVVGMATNGSGLASNRRPVPTTSRYSIAGPCAGTSAAIALPASITAPPPRLTTAPTPFSRARRTPRSISCRSGSWAIDSVVTFSW